MDSERKRELITSLKCRLNQDTRGEEPIARLSWLLSHIEEYLERWNSWLVYYDSVHEFLQNDLHVTLALAVDVFDEEMYVGQTSDAFRRKWKAFAETLRNIDRETDKRIADQLKWRLQSVRDELLQ